MISKKTVGPLHRVSCALPSPSLPLLPARRTSAKDDKEQSPQRPCGQRALLVERVNLLEWTGEAGLLGELGVALAELDVGSFGERGA